MISFVIPAFNEEGTIGQTLKAIDQYCAFEEKEVIVVDNGSTDNTAAEATELGARVCELKQGTIAAVRNYGVSQSQGDVLIFIDADVLLTAKWAENIQAQIADLRAKPMLVTGSRCHPPQNGNWFNEHWYQHMTEQATSYINSGHLITSRELFEQIGGFTEALKTAEDYDFCQKANAAGADVKANFDLVTVHDGYPKTLAHFLQRERWHGKEDYLTLTTTLRSKVALVAMANLFLFTLAILVSFATYSALGFIAYLVLMTAISVALTIIKFKQISLNILLHSSAIHFFYIWGRTLALFDRLFDKKVKRFREQN